MSLYVRLVDGPAWVESVAEVPHLPAYNPVPRNHQNSLLILHVNFKKGVIAKAHFRHAYIPAKPQVPVSQQHVHEDDVVHFHEELQQLRLVKMGKMG